MKRQVVVITNLILFLFSFQALSQRIYSMVFNKLPQESQFYARNKENKSTISLSGIIELADWSYFSVVVTKDGKPYSYVKSDFIYPENNKSRGTFSLKITLEAALAEYQLKFYAVQNPKDSVLMATRSKILVGDAYVVSGQSNSYSGPSQELYYRGKFTRSFGRFYSDYENFQAYQERDTLWSVANEQPIVGPWAGEIARQIVENDKIPVCIINGGSGGSSMAYNEYRDPNNPFNLATANGRLLYRVEKAGLRNQIKAFIYRQGENDANANQGIGWKDLFTSHVNNIKKEYPNLEKIYLVQINVINGNNPSQGTVREYQRAFISNNGFIKGIATVGLLGHDGIHYSFEGHKRAAIELYRILAEDFYKHPRDLANYSPNVQQAKFLNKEKTKFVIQFDVGQQLATPSDSLFSTNSGNQITQKISDFLFFNVRGEGTTTNISKITVLHRNLLVDLSKPPTTEVISYLPSYYPENSPISQFGGPYLKNKAGMRAFTFENIAIQSYELNQNVDLDEDGIIDDLDDCPLIKNPLKPIIQQTNLTDLSIQGGVSAQWFLNGKQIDGATAPSIKAFNSGNYIVRIADQNGCKSPLSDVFQLLITESKTDFITQIYPNPTFHSFRIRLSNQMGKYCQLEVFDHVGKLVLTKENVMSQEEISVSHLPVSSYLVRLTGESNKTVTLKLLKLE